jgi:hypothetical protein
MFLFQDKMEEMQQHNMSWIEVQFLKKAVDILCECRRTLMFTYVFAYYLKKNNQSEIFEVMVDQNRTRGRHRCTRVARFSLVQHTRTGNNQSGTKYTRNQSYDF